MQQSPYGITIFCDDIRFEMAGKYSLIGVYNDVMYINVPFPAILPKFAMSVMIRFPFKQRQIKTFELRIYWPGNEDDEKPDICQIVQPEEQEDHISSSLKDSDTIVKHWGGHLVFAPLKLKTTGRIKVRAVVNGEVIKLGTLRVEQPPTDDQSAPTEE